MKRYAALILVFCLTLCVCAAPAAAGAEAVPKSSAACSLRAFGGSVACFFHKILNSVKGVNEMDLPSPAIRPDKAAPSKGVPEVDPALPAIKAETWRAVETEFTSAKDYADPFGDVTLDLVLTDGAIQYTIPCFWDGGRVWKARMACPHAGKWYFETVCSSKSDSGLDGKTGVIECSEYSGELEIYRRGFVTTRAGKKFFTYADGTPFFYLGDTHWSLGDETVDMVREIAAKRAGQGFTVWQSEPIGEKFDLTDGVSEADMEGFRSYDEKFRVIADAGLTHANAEFFFPSGMDTLIMKSGGYTGREVTGIVDGRNVTVNEMSDEAKKCLEALSRYWVARYGAYPVMWTLGQEVDNDFYRSDTNHPGWNALNNPYKLVAAYIDKYDAYTHPLSAHQEHSGATAAYGSGLGAAEKLTSYSKAAPSAFRDVPSHDFYAAQWSPSKTGPYDAGAVRDFWYNSQGKPSINYEGQYCYLWTKDFGARMQGWLAYLNGMYGCSWGGQDTWSYLNVYSEDEDSDDGVDVITSREKKEATWRDALGYPSARQLGYMRAFLEDGKWWELIPRFFNRSYFMPDSKKVYAVCAADEGSTETVVYIYSFTDPSVAAKANTTGRGGLLTGTVGHLEPSAEYDYRWFDPVTGGYGGSGTFKASPLGTVHLGEKPSAADWAIRITKK